MSEIPSKRNQRDLWTRQHSRRMLTARLPIVLVSEVTTNVSTVEAGEGVLVGPRVNKFEQVSSDDHQISVARGGGRCRGLMSVGGGGGTTCCLVPLQNYVTDKNLINPKQSARFPQTCGIPHSMTKRSSNKFFLLYHLFSTEQESKARMKTWLTLYGLNSTRIKALFTRDIFFRKNGPLLFSIMSMNNGQNDCHPFCPLSSPSPLTQC